MKKVAAVLGIFLLSFQTFLFAENKEPLKLNIHDAVDYAIKGNLSLKRSQLALDSAEHAANSAWGVVIPSVSASGQFNQSLLDPQNASVTVTGAVSLTLTPSLITSIRSVSLAYEQQEIAYETAVKNIEFSVRQLFTQLLYSQEYIRVLEDNVASAKRQYESDLAKYNRGTLPQVNILTDQVSMQSAQLTLESQKSTLENSKATFKQTLGLRQDTDIILEGSLEDVMQIEDITMEKVQKVRKQSTAMASLLKQKESAENSLLASRFTAWGPRVTVGYSIGWSGNDVSTDMSSGTPVTTKGDFKFNEDPATHALSVGVSIPLDGWLPWSSTGLNIAKADAALDDYDLQIENQRITEEINIQNYLNTIKTTQANIKLAKSNLELARRNLTLTEEAYNHGTKSLLELQNARDKLSSTQVSVMSNASSLLTAILNLENTLGIPFDSLGKTESTQTGNK